MQNVTATVAVKLQPFDKNIVKLGIKFKLKCMLWGQDSGFNGGNDDLFAFPTHVITDAGSFTFKATVNRDILDEDSVGNDEVFAKFTFQPTQPIFAPITKSSPVISGNF